MRVLLQPAFVLHSRLYRNTSLLIEAFTRDYGRVGLLAKGVRNSRLADRGLLQAFNGLLLSYSGRGELMTLTAVENEGCFLRLSGKALYCGMYLNELLLKLLPRHDPHEGLFDCYHKSLQALVADSMRPEPVLRRFELQLLAELGYALSLQSTADTFEQIQPEKKYYYDPERGPLLNNAVSSFPVPYISGRCLIDLQNEVFDDTACMREMKLLIRYVLAHYMGGKPLKSRELFKV